MSKLRAFILFIENIFLNSKVQFGAHGLPHLFTNKTLVWTFTTSKVQIWDIFLKPLTTMQWLDWSQDRLLLTQSRCHNWRRAQLENIKKPKCPNSRFFARRQQPQELWWVGPWQAISSTKRRLPPIVSDPAKAAARHSSLGKLKTNTNPPANHIYHLQICWQTNKQISKAMLR